MKVSKKYKQSLEKSFKKFQKNIGLKSFEKVSKKIFKSFKKVLNFFIKKLKKVFKKFFI